MNVIIVEDELIIADHLAQILTDINVNVLEIIDDLDEAEKSLVKSPEFYFLDIRLSNNQSGIEFGKILNNLGIPFVYITANNELEILKKAIATQPISYITKPFKERDVIAAVELIRLKTIASRFLQITTPKGVKQIAEQEILYCEAEGSYVKIVTRNEVFIQRMTLKKTLEMLSKDFIRIHRSFIVNKHKINSHTANSIYLYEFQLPVSRAYKNFLSKK
ncbi:MAG: response regulator transcription factor [Bacteroidetes bacterium]|nr:response regulator transcription factor [Bacteroidota bacterium]